MIRKLTALVLGLPLLFINGCETIHGTDINMSDTERSYKGRPNLAINANVESSLPRYQPGLYNHFPEAVNDGQIGEHHGWAALTNETGHWIKLDLIDDISIDLVRVMNFIDKTASNLAAKKCRIEIRDSELRVVLNKRFELKETDVAEFKDISFPAVKGRYVQVAIDSFYSQDGGGFAEIEVYGSEQTVVKAKPRNEPPPARQEVEFVVEQVTQHELQRPKGVNFGKYHAIVIGNNNYRTLPKLKTAVNDARTVSKLLRNNYNYDVTLLENATRFDILTSFDTVLDKLTSRDNLLIYYAGHGWLDPDGDEGYWLPVDASRASRVNWVSNASITTVLKGLKAKHVLVVADSCYSGKLTRGLSIKQRKPGYLEHASRQRVRSVLASGGLEPVSDDGMNGHSVFAGAFIKTLQENDAVLLGDQLFQKIFRPVKLNADQTPEYSDIRKAGHQGGDFIFIRK